MRPSIFIYVFLTMLLASTAVAGTHLFILSGQSNMDNLNERASFVPTITAALPADRCVVVKDAVPGAAISGWVAGDRPYYIDLLAAVADADCKPDTITFCWMQGEADTTAALCDTYERKLARLVRDLRSDLDFDSMGVVIGRINGKRGTYWNIVRAAQVAVAGADPAGRWIDTDDLPLSSDALHFTAAGYEQLGGRFALAAVALLGRQPADIIIVPGEQKEVVAPDTGGCFCSTLPARRLLR